MSRTPPAISFSLGTDSGTRAAAPPGAAQVRADLAAAYRLAATLVKACRIRVAALAGNPHPVPPSAAAVERAAQELFDNGALEGGWEWPALLRSLRD